MPFPLLIFLLLLPSHAAPPLFHHHRPGPARPTPIPARSNQTQCDLFTGSWVFDPTYPLYQAADCPVIDPEFNCQLYGRPDSDYLRFRWKPAACEMPRFDGARFLGRMRGKTVMFVGDSLGRNQWESLVCLLASAIPRSSPIQSISGETISSYGFLDYGVTISFHKATYLVDIDMIQGKRVLKLDDVSQNSKFWKGVDVLSFNSGHWWTHRGSLQGWDYMELDGMIYQDMDRLTAFDIGLKTWANWVDTNVDRTRTRVFFQSISPTHYNPSEWSSGAAATPARNCYGETTPATGLVAYTADGYPLACADQMRVVQSVLSSMSQPAYLLDITMMSAMRKDGHPSIYSGDVSPNQRANPSHSSDCSHWCLPGLPDSWNQLFYTALFYI